MIYDNIESLGRRHNILHQYLHVHNTLVYVLSVRPSEFASQHCCDCYDFHSRQISRGVLISVWTDVIDAHTACEYLMYEGIPNPFADGYPGHEKPVDKEIHRFRTNLDSENDIFHMISCFIHNMFRKNID